MQVETIGLEVHSCNTLTFFSLLLSHWFIIKGYNAGRDAQSRKGMKFSCCLTMSLSSDLHIFTNLEAVSKPVSTMLRSLDISSQTMEAFKGLLSRETAWSAPPFEKSIWPCIGWVGWKEDQSKKTQGRNSCCPSKKILSGDVSCSFFVLDLVQSSCYLLINTVAT